MKRVKAVLRWCDGSKVSELVWLMRIDLTQISCRFATFSAGGIDTPIKDKTAKVAFYWLQDNR
jgi:hypothetical protein